MAWKRLLNVLVRMVTFQPVFRFRFWPSLFHALVGWGFGFYILVDLFDVVKGYLPGFVFPGVVGRCLPPAGRLALGRRSGRHGLLRLPSLRLRPANLSTRQTTLLSPKARFGIWRDSAIVATFILLHVGVALRWRIARHRCGTAKPDSWQPFASLVVAGCGPG